MKNSQEDRATERSIKRKLTWKISDRTHPGKTHKKIEPQKDPSRKNSPGFDQTKQLQQRPTRKSAEEAFDCGPHVHAEESKVPVDDDSADTEAQEGAEKGQEERHLPANHVRVGPQEQVDHNGQTTAYDTQLRQKVSTSVLHLQTITVHQTLTTFTCSGTISTLVCPKYFVHCII